MAMVINTNALSLNAQNNLNKSQQSLNTAIERLSSGSRINSAKDDAAGLAISNRMNAQVTGLNQANRNANDGISVAQTAEGALSQVTDNLQRVRELTVQAQNETLSQSDRGSIQDEIGQRLEEINRLAGQTEFNGKKLLDGSNPTLKIQVGANDGQTIDLNLTNVSAASLGVDTFNVNGPQGALATAQYDNAGTPTNVTNGTVVDGAGTDVSGTYTLQQDSKGSYFATDGTDTFAVSDVSVSDAGAASYTVDVAGGAVTAATTDPLKAIDKALSDIDSARSTLGAQQNRLQSAVEGNSTTSTNLSSAMSQIKDADYATEVSNMSKAQILQQAGTSVLAQANQTTQGVMSLLR